MTIISRLLTVTCAVSMLSTQASAYLAGVKNSLDIGVIEQAKDVYFNEIRKLIDNFDLPDIYLPNDKGYLLGQRFILQSDAGDVNFSTDVGENAVVFSIDNLTG